MSRAPLLLLSLASLLAASPARAQGEPVPSWAEAATLQRRFDEVLRPALDEALGAPLEGGAVEVVLADRVALAAVLAADEERPYAKEGEVAGHVRSACRMRAEALAPFVLAKRDIEGPRLLVSPDALGRVVERDGRAADAALLDVALLHEAVHAHQHARFDLGAFLAGAPTPEDLAARLAVVEGHAQAVARRAAAALGLGEAAGRFEALLDLPPRALRGTPQGEALGALLSIQAYRHREGAACVEHLARALGLEGATRRLFTRPPRSRRLVSHPEELLAPRAAPDVAALGPKLAALLDARRFAARALVMPEPAVRATLAPAGEEARARALAAFREGVAVVAPLRDAAPPAAPSALLVAYLCGSPEEAVTFTGVLERVTRARHAALRAGEGGARCLSATLRPGPAPGYRAEVTLELEGGARRVLVAVTLQEGPWVVEDRKSVV